MRGMMRGLIAVAMAALVACPPAAWAQDTLRLQLERNNILRLEDTIPSLDPNRRYTVVITNVNEDRPDWGFSLGGSPLERIPPESDDEPLAFALDAGTAQVDGSLGRVNLSFTDDAGGENAVRLSLDPLEIPLAEGARTEVTRRDVLQADPRLISQRFRTRYNRRENAVRLVFDAKGLPIGSLPTDLDDNDVFNIIMLLPSTDDVAEYSVELIGDFAGDDFNILASGVVEDLRDRLGILRSAGDTLVPHDMGTFGPFASGALEIAVKKGEEQLRRYKVKINKNYLAALRFGIGRSTIRFNEFAVRTFSGAQGDSTRILNVADEDGEPRVFLSVVFYAWRFWENRFWHGRDVQEPPGLLDRINPFVGVGLQNFGEEYLVGLSAEVARGLDFVWAVHIAQTDRLGGGFQEGQVVDGQAGDLPLEEKWRVRGNFIGGSVDLRVAVSVLRTVLGGG